MVPALLAVLFLYLVQTFVPQTMRIFLPDQSKRAFFLEDIGPRDKALPSSLYIERAERALSNLKEALPIFLPVALLLIVFRIESESALRGAWIYFGARFLYLPAYVSGVPGLRSVFWVTSWVGLLLMVSQLPL